MAKKTNLVMNVFENDEDSKLGDDNNQTFTFGEDGDKCTESRLDMRLLRSSIFKLEIKLKLQSKVEETPRMETGEFLTHNFYRPGNRQTQRLFPPTPRHLLLKIDLCPATQQKPGINGKTLDGLNAGLRSAMMQPSDNWCPNHWDISHGCSI